MREAILSLLHQRAALKENLMFFTGDLGFGALDNFINDFPEKFINAGIAEQNMTAMACGMSLEGFETYTYSISNFTTMRCYEQIRNDICYHNSNVTIISVGAGFSYGQLGISHFSTEDIAIMRVLPNMHVFSPSSKNEAKELFKSIVNIDGPKYLRIDKSDSNLDHDTPVVEIGVPRRVREGDSLTIFATGGILEEASKAADYFAAKNISIRLVSVHTLKPFDPRELIDACVNTSGIITLEEHSLIGGLGSLISEYIVDLNLSPGFVHRMGIKDIFPSVVGDQNFLRSYFSIDSQSLIEQISSLLKLF